MITENKKLKLTFLISSLLYFIAMSVCFICDMAMNKTITWSAYPLGIIPFAWIISSALLLAKRNRILVSLAAATLAAIPLLYFIEQIAPVTGWFSALGLPLSVTALIAIWITYALVRFLSINKWYLSAIIVFIFGVAVNCSIHYFLDRFLNRNLFSFENIINILGSVIITALLCIVGYYNSMNKELKKEDEN